MPFLYVAIPSFLTSQSSFYYPSLFFCSYFHSAILLTLPFQTTFLSYTFSRFPSTQFLSYRFTLVQSLYIPSPSHTAVTYNHHHHHHYRDNYQSAQFNATACTNFQHPCHYTSQPQATPTYTNWSPHKHNHKSCTKKGRNKKETTFHSHSFQQQHHQHHIRMGPLNKG